MSKTQMNRRRTNIEEGIATAAEQVAASATSLVPGILQGRCVLCSTTLTDHFKEGRWIGCAGGHRPGDTLFVPPMTILMTPAADALVPEAFGRGISLTPITESNDMGQFARRSVDEVTAATRRIKRQFQTIAKHGAAAAKSVGARGRTAYLYFAGPKAAPKDITEGDAKFYKTVASHKKGLTFKDIVSRTKLPASTADWARIRLMKSGALIRKPVTA